MALPSLPCTSIEAGAQGLCATLPGGATVCIAFPSVKIPTGLQAAKQMIGQLNAALTPLSPLFRILDCLASVPDVVTDPTGFLEKLAALASCLPPVSVPYVIAGFLDALIAFLGGLVAQLHAIIDQQARLLAAATKAATLGNTRLQLNVDCANAQLTAQLVSLNAGMAPLNSIIGTVNLIAAFAPGMPSIPSLATLGADLESEIIVLDGVVATLTAMRAALPI